MKQLIFILLLIPAMLSGQTNAKDIKSDTSYLERDIIPDDWTGPEDSIFYEVRTVTYSNGREETIREPVGDTVTTQNYLTNRTLDINRQLAQAAAVTIQRPSVIRAGRVSNKALSGAGLGSVYSRLDSLTWREYLNPAVPTTFLQNYTATVSGTDNAATMRRMGNGNIRLSFSGNNYVCTPLSETWLRVKDFPTAGQFSDLFRTGPRRWETVTGVNQGNRIIPALVLRKSGQ